MPAPFRPYGRVAGMTTSISLMSPQREMVLGYRTRAKDKKRDARKNGKERKRKGNLCPLNLRYNRGKHKVLNYFMWTVWGQG